jgi:hypothetical protein
MTVLGMVFMVLGGLLLLSALRSYALYRANRRQPAARVGGAGWYRLVAAMLATGLVLLALGYLLAFS